VKPTEEIGECLGQPDHVLFTHRGCHVFADTLLQRFHTENSKLKTIEINDGYGPATSGFHVLAHRDGFLVDAHGIKREQDYCLWLCGKRALANPDMPVPFVRAIEINSLELFKIASYDQCGLPLNKWGHLVDPEFIRVVGERAAVYVEPIAERFQVSILLAGFELRGVSLNRTSI
jgi:hypothetical protein